ncbi:ABC transporter ATP-binding protein [Roseburia hominis]|uniref:ABC transporter ATP-binding protein n=1 Tax=Roseburia hominis TaxID=301301 RepID=UPI001F3C66F6|nr:ABC transporter ATP-binding protein [Roseburia hominis]
MKKEKERSTFSWVFEFAGQKKNKYILSVILAILGAVCQMLPYLVVAHMVQKLLAGNRDFGGYVIDCAVMSIMWLLRVLFHALSTGASHVATFTVLGNIRKRGMDKLAHMPLGDVQDRGSGELKNILVERIDSVETTLAHVIPEVSSNLFVVVAMLVYLFIIDWRMALASLITFPVGMLCFMGMMIGYDENYNRTVRAVKNLNDTAVEYIGGIEVIKVFGKAKSSYEKFVAAAKEGAASYVDWMRKCNVFHVFAMNIMPATLISVLPIGGVLVHNGSLALSDFILVIIIAMGLITPIIGCMSYEDDLAKLRTVMGEIVAILDAKEMKRPAQDKVKPSGNTIKLSDVHFGYDEKEVLHGINLTLQEVTVNAFVGPSGGGKSTIAKLIASFWDVNSGKITIGGVDIRDLSMEQYQKRIAYVAQDNFLFDDTIRENIRMGNLSATDEMVEKAAKDCGCYDFIMSLENGFDTVVGSGGGHLSGGEKQRICIARAMLKDAPIVILDEATAYTDPENEAVIQASVAKLVQGKTLIVIAHRLSTITDADQIVVVEQGRINATGTHEELLTKSRLYQKLWNSHISSKDSLTGGEVHA